MSISRCCTNVTRARANTHTCTCGVREVAADVHRLCCALSLSRALSLSSLPSCLLAYVMIISYSNNSVKNNFLCKQGALDYWYTADETCVSHGPHFNYVLYVTVAHVMASFCVLLLCLTWPALHLHSTCTRALTLRVRVSQASVASLVGIFVFQGAMSGWTYRSLFVITTVLQADINENIEI